MGCFAIAGGSGRRQKFSKLLSALVRKQIPAYNKKPASRLKIGPLQSEKSLRNKSKGIFCFMVAPAGIEPASKV